MCVCVCVFVRVCVCVCVWGSLHCVNEIVTLLNLNCIYLYMANCNALCIR